MFRGTGASMIYWPVGAACAGAGAIFFTAAFLTAAFFTAAFFVTAVFAGAFAAAFCKRHRFFVAATILAMLSLLIRRFGFVALAGAGGSDLPLILAHLAFCAIAIFRLEAALNLLRFLVPGAIRLATIPLTSSSLTSPPLARMEQAALPNSVPALHSARNISPVEIAGILNRSAR